MSRALEAVLAVLIAAIALPAPAVEPIATPGGPTAQEVAQHNQDIADATWNALPVSPGVERPVVVLGESIAEDDWPAAFVACLGDAGYEIGAVLSVGDGALTPAGTEELDDATLLAFYRCVVTHPREFTSRAFYSAAQLDYLYRHYERWQVPCLLMQGYRIYEVPTREEFVADGGRWSPGTTLITDVNGHPVQTVQSHLLMVNRCGANLADAMLQ